MFYCFNATVWKYSGQKSSWYFVTLPKDVAIKIKFNTRQEAKLQEDPKPKKNFGSIKIVAKIEQIQWKTSIFSYPKASSYILPIKADVRKRLQINENDQITITIQTQPVFCC